MISATLADFVAEHEARRPAAVAVRDDAGALTYAELGARAGRLAGVLAERGIGAGDHVGLFMERGVNLVVAVLAVLKTGAVYVVLDPRYSTAQRERLLRDARARALISGPSLEVSVFDGERASSGSHVCVLSSLDIAGGCKQVFLEHRALALAAAGLPRLSAEDKVAQVASLSSATGNLEAALALLSAVELVVLPDLSELMAVDLQRELRRRQVTVMIATGTTINEIVRTDREAFSSLRLLISNADVIRPETCRNIFASDFSGTLINLYGSEQTAAACAAFAVHEVSPKAIDIPIGRAFDGYDLRVRDCRLYIDGADSGDLARENERGELVLIGRSTDRIELHGRSVDAAEVERMLCRSTEVGDATVLFDGAGDDLNIVAFLAPSGEAISLKKLCGMLREHLPSELIPTDFVVTRSLPMDLRGRRNRGAMRTALDQRRERRDTRVAPRSEIERYLVDVWEELLATRHVGVLDDFFELGGHSLLAYEVRNAIERDLGASLDFQIVFENSVLQDLADVIAQAKRSGTYESDRY